MKQKNECLKNLFLVLSIISLVLIIFIGSFSALFLNSRYYDALYTKTGTYERIYKDIAINKTEELFLFFEDKSSLDSNFYTENEISHLSDVKILIKKVFIAYYLSLFSLLLSIIIAWKYLKADLSLFISKILFYSGIAIIVMALIIILFLVSNFGGLFENFHRLFFKGNYMFPDSSNMIKLFSEDFFRLFAQKIFLTSLIKGLAAAFAGGFLIWRYKHKNNKISSHNK
jgi:hypothetical protein